MDVGVVVVVVDAVDAEGGDGVCGGVRHFREM